MKKYITAELIDEVKSWRHYLHQHPELAFQEKLTAAFVVQKLKDCGFKEDEIHQGLGGTGVVATLRGNGSPTHSEDQEIRIGLRADMDALPLEEKNNFSHRSQTPGQMHACGHDGHTAMLLGAAKYLKQNPHFKGVVYFIFQPAEEGLGGAKKMIEDGLFELFPMDAVFGLHNWPTLAEGHVATRPGPIMAASDFVSFKIKGQGGHAALPHLTIDPMVVSAQLILALQTIVSRKSNPLQSYVLSLTKIQGGTTHNIIPEEVTLSGSCRALTHEGRDFLEKEIKRVAQGIAQAYGAHIESDYRRGYPPTINSTEEAHYVYEVAKKVLQQEEGESDKVHFDLDPSMGAEDFSYMLEKKPGCYFWIGTGRPENGDCTIHSPYYDFNDNIISLGVNLWVSLVLSRH